ncbi:MAG: cation-transporting P-type ATPase, partial [Geminicoccaceae bacterium]
MNGLADAAIKAPIGRTSGPTWHADPVAEIYATLGTGPRGLSSEEAAGRLEAHGPNELPAPPGLNPIRRFLAQFNNPVIYFLVAAAVAAWVIGHRVDAAVIIAVVLINAIVGFIQEGKAEKALNAIRKMISPQASTLR